MGEIQRSNLEAAAAFYAAGPATSDEERRGFFASDFVWHVPGDTDLSSDYSGDAYFTEMPARMQPLDEVAFTTAGATSLRRFRYLTRATRAGEVGGLWVLGLCSAA